MNKTLLVFKNEFITTITRRSFLIMLFVVPLGSFLVFGVISLLQDKTPGSIGATLAPTPRTISEGYVDHSGLIRALPDGLEPGRLVAFASEDEARQALATERISAFYVIPADYISSGRVTYVRADFNPLAGLDEAAVISNVLRYNLLGGDVTLVSLIQSPLKLEKVSLSPEPQRDQDNLLTFFLPYGVAMLSYFVILTSASYLLNSITTEKQNRVIEILMASITPNQMLAGKIAALGLIGLLQAIIWSGTGFILLRMSGSTFNVAAAFQLPPSILLWFIVFFLLGYALYAGLMSGIGALVPNLREASQVTTVVIIPMVIPLMFLSALISDPSGALAVGLSLFPLTAPVTILTRLAAGAVPLWQLLLSAAILAASAVLVIRGVGGSFRAQTLLSGQPPNLKRYLAALTGRLD